MLEIYGKQVPETLEELVNTKHTAVINIDIQNDGCSKGGQQDRMGLDISMCQAIIPNVAKLAEEARKAGALVIHSQNLSLPDHRSDSPAWLRFKMRTYIPKGESDYSPEGTWGADFVDEVKPQPGDIVVKKHRSDCFQGTNLDLILRSNDIKTVIITGVVTQGCVESTARSAAFHDYFVVIPKDCVGTSKPEYQEASLKIMQYRFDVVTSQEVIKAWQATKK